MSSTTTRRPNRRGEGARLRDEIVRAAGDLLEESGSAEAVTLRAVARRVGIAAPSIYAHFDDREAIVLGVVQEAFDQLTAAIRAGMDGADDPVERVHRGCMAYVRFALERPGRYQVLFGHSGALDAIGDEPPKPAPRADGLPEPLPGMVGAEPFGLLVDAIAACVAAGRSRVSDPWHGAVLVWVAIHGYAGLVCGVPDFPWDDREGTVRELVSRLALLD